MVEEKTYRLKRRMVGVVSSVAGHKTVVVSVTRRVQHPVYKKYLNRTKKFMAHDEACECKVGDVVEIVEFRPISKRKRWWVRKRLESGESLNQADVV
jgi:small subunit ribosomal protein S17